LGSWRARPRTLWLSTGVGPALNGRPLNDEEAGPKARLSRGDATVDYQLRVAGQPPLVLERVQERVTLPSAAFAMVNTLPVFEVTDSE
jgi:hypothetical protein